MDGHYLVYGLEKAAKYVPNYQYSVNYSGKRQFVLEVVCRIDGFGGKILDATQER